MNTYARLPVSFVRGEGIWLWDNRGRRYLDGLGGIAVTILGHAHPKLAEVIAKQARTLTHTSNLYHIPLQEQLGERLFEMSGLDKAFFTNSGAEANEAAIKIARRYGHKKGVETPAILVTEGAFHGRTLATLTATGNRKVHSGFEPLVSGFKRVPYDDLEAIRQVAVHDSDVVAILVEPIQGEGGIQIPSAGYLTALREICSENGWLLMLDEIQTGMGRTGQWFAYQQESITPDVVTLAKALGNGIPIGVCLAQGAAGEVFQPGNHGSTFGGNPFACKVALTTIELLQMENALMNARHQGKRIMAGLDRHLSGNSKVRSIRGKGLMLGVELSVPCGEIMSIALKHGLLLNVTADNVVRLLPALIYTDADSDHLVELVVKSIEEFLSA